MDLQLDSQESFLHWIIAHILKCAHLRDIMVAVMGTEICLQSGDEKQEQECCEEEQQRKADPGDYSALKGNTLARREEVQKSCCTAAQGRTPGMVPSVRVALCYKSITVSHRKRQET
ncbi:hypothetical protein Anapl_01628 [Anas platyrhynchos]|uniref:Uncharacterized protein n=1 Tax=Anas platyrhynchos TaxID=8839 RepID=R0LM36_ANAPL|nr:hypothetical protein Anapl_01628 [Anas platyrhynchos]